MLNIHKQTLHELSQSIQSIFFIYTTPPLEFFVLLNEYTSGLSIVLLCSFFGIWIKIIEKREILVEMREVEKSIKIE